MRTNLIAVTGATGQLGRRLAYRLAAEGAAQRLVVRDPDRAPNLAGAEIAVTRGYSDGAGMRAAFAGASTVVLIPAAETPDRVEQHVSAIDAAVSAGVERLVYVSFVGADPRATFTLARQHALTEARVRESGLRFTFLRMSLFDALLPRMVGADGVIRGPAGVGLVASVAHDDVADVATAVLLDEVTGAHDGETYDVTGPELLSLADVAERLSRATGRDVTYRAETIEEAYASRAAMGATAFEVAGWVTSYAAIGAGELAVVSPTVERLTGREAQSFAAWLESNRAELDHLLP